MAIPGMSGAAPMDPNSPTAPSAQPATPEPKLFDGYDEMAADNRERAQLAQKKAEEFITKHASDLTYTEKWFVPDYITYTPSENSKMTFGELRSNLGIPPRVISDTNKFSKKVTDSDVITEPVKIGVNQIGWHELRMDNEQSAIERSFRDHGDRYAGYGRGFSSDSDVSEMIQQTLEKQKAKNK